MLLAAFNQDFPYRPTADGIEATQGMVAGATKVSVEGPLYKYTPTPSRLRPTEDCARLFFVLRLHSLSRYSDSRSWTWRALVVCSRCFMRKTLCHLQWRPPLSMKEKCCGIIVLEIFLERSLLSFLFFYFYYP